MVSLRNWLLASGATLWIVLFLGVNLAFPLPGGTNADSRFALLQAWAEDGSSRIDAYRHQTSDWARAPDGHYYSNKAPGPSLLAFPIYWVIDRITTARLPDRAARDEFRYRYKARVQKLLAFLLQMLPFAALLATAGHALKGRGVSRAGRDAALFALAFGSTASLFFNSFFGHGCTAVAVLAFTLAALEGWAFIAGLALGIAVLCDYGTPALLPAAALAFYAQLRPNFRRFLGGAAGPAVAWIAYHHNAFGSPFTIASRFQNPEFVDKAVNYPLWGTLRLPSPETMAHLLVGAERGILWTQPWVLFLLPVAVALAMVAPGDKKALGRFSVLGLLGLLLLNASFNGWYGGLCPGPRYLCAIFPVWALFLGLAWDGLADSRRRALTVGLALSGALAVLVFCTNLAVPLTPIWPYLAHQVAASTATAKIRVGVLMAVATMALVWQKRHRQLG